VTLKVKCKAEWRERKHARIGEREGDKVYREREREESG
jgi:hypothetical protein